MAAPNLDLEPRPRTEASRPRRSGADATAERVTAEYRFVPLDDLGHWIPEQDPALVAHEVLARIA